MDFPVAGITVSPWVPLLTAFAISLVTSTGGVSGAFLLLPFQMSVLGFTTPAVSATNHLYNVVAIPGGIWGYMRERRLVAPLAAAIVAGSIPGVVVGAWIRVRWLPDPADFRLFAGAVLLWVGGQMAYRLVQPGRPAPSAPDGHGWAVTGLRRTGGTVAYVFRGTDYRFHVVRMSALALAVGVVGGVYGIGGGAIIAPFVVTFFGLPVHTVAGAALLGTFATSLAGTLSFQALAPLQPDLQVAPDWGLGLLFGLGGLAGTYAGARLQRRLPDRAIRGMLALVLLFVGLRYLLS